MARGNLDFEAWLADRIKYDLKERCGIDIEVSGAEPNAQQMIPPETRLNPKANEAASLDKLGNVLEPKQAQATAGSEPEEDL